MDKGNPTLDPSSPPPDLPTLAAVQLRKMGLRAPKLKLTKASDAGQASCSSPAGSAIFGVAIEEQPMVLSQDSGLLVPRFLHMATAYLSQHSSTEGLFRKSGSVARQRELRRVLEAGGKLEAVPVHDVAGLLKQWFRELPEPVVPKPLQTLLLRCQRERGLEAVQLALLVLPTGHVRVLRHTCLFLAEVARHSGCNRMDAPNLALVLAPNFFSAPTVQRPRGEPLQSQASLLQLLVEQAPQVGVVPPTLRGTMHAEVAGALPRQRRRTAAAALLCNLRNLVPLRRGSVAEGAAPGSCTPVPRDPVGSPDTPLELLSLDCSPRGPPLLKRRTAMQQDPPGLTPCKRTKHQSEVADENCPEPPRAMACQSAEPTLPVRCHSAMLGPNDRPGLLLPDERFVHRTSPGGLQRVATWNAARRLHRGRPNTCQSGLPSPLQLSNRRRRAVACTAVRGTEDGGRDRRLPEEEPDGLPGQDRGRPSLEPTELHESPAGLAPGDAADDSVGDTTSAAPAASGEVGNDRHPQPPSEDSAAMEVDTGTPEQSCGALLPGMPPPEQPRSTLLPGMPPPEQLWGTLLPEMPPQECASKRESIIQIRQRNAGMVRNSVLLFDAQPAPQCHQWTPALRSRPESFAGRSPLRETNFAVPHARTPDVKPAWLDYEPRDWEMSL
ncbi:unconventional myosin-IXa isoform X1 [Ixodes scapularis]